MHLLRRERLVNSLKPALTSHAQPPTPDQDGYTRGRQMTLCWPFLDDGPRCHAAVNAVLCGDACN